MVVNIFLTDASFDYKTRVAVIGIFELVSKEKYQFIYEDAKNSSDAELYGLKKAVEIAGRQDKVDNVVFICDNKSAVNIMKKEFFSKEELRAKFWYAQFIWLPREYTWIVDFLSKNIDKNLSESLLEAKESKVEKTIQKKEERMFEHNVNSINVDKDKFSLQLFEKRKNQFLLLSDKTSFNSTFFRHMENLSIYELTSLIFDEIEEIEKDLEKIKKEDILIYYSAKSLFDLIVSI